eukprot:g30731.t1
MSNLALALHKCGKVTEAIKQAYEVLRLCPKAHVVTSLPEWLFLLKDFEGADKVLKKFPSKEILLYLALLQFVKCQKGQCSAEARDDSFDKAYTARRSVCNELLKAYKAGRPRSNKGCDCSYPLRGYACGDCNDKIQVQHIYEVWQSVPGFKWLQEKHARKNFSEREESVY